MESDGFAIVEHVIPAAAVSELIATVETQGCGSSGALPRRRRGGRRGLLETVPEVRRLSASFALRSLVEPVLWPDCFPMRGLFFDKTPFANWGVPWHRDMTIAVKRRIDVSGFAGWSVKGGVDHVQAPPFDPGVDACGANSP